MASIRLGEIAYARSGDKGAGANIGVIARSPADYAFLRDHLTARRGRAILRYDESRPGCAI